MSTLAYTYTKNIKDLLIQIEASRANLALYPLSLKNETRIIWETEVERIFWSLGINLYPNITRELIAGILINDKKIRFRDIEKDILNFHKAINYIKENWLVTQEEVTTEIIKKLYLLSSYPTSYKPKDNFESIKPGLKNILDYLQKGQEHPLIQASIAYLQITRLKPFEYGTNRVARLVVYLFLYKFGYNFRNLLTFEKNIKNSQPLFQKTLNQAYNLNNSTYWIEYFLNIVSLSLNEKLQSLKENTSQLTLPEVPYNFWEISKRQKDILNILQKPGSQVGNSDIKNKFGISQITASRDLSKLAKLGLLFTHGKGRSIKYIKV